jgi:hypothetical protein
MTISPEEMNKLERMNPSAAEYSVQMNYSGSDARPALGRQVERQFRSEARPESVGQRSLWAEEGEGAYSGTP